MNTRIGRSARNFSSKVPSFVLLTKARFKRDDHSRTSIQTGVDSMSPTMRLVFPASHLTKTSHAGEVGRVIEQKQRTAVTEAELVKLE